MDVSYRKRLLQVQAKINQIEMLRRRGVDISRAQNFYEIPEKQRNKDDPQFLVIDINEDELFPEWIDIARTNIDEQKKIIDLFESIYTIVINETDEIILNTRYPGRFYTALDKKTNDPLDHFYVFYPIANKDGKYLRSEFEYIVEQFQYDIEYNVPRKTHGAKLDDVVIIIISDNKIMIPPDIRKKFGKRIQIMYHDQIYPDNHVLQPRYEKIPIQEANNILLELNIKKTQMPKVYENDQVVKYYGWYPGDLLRVYRKTSGIPTFVRETVSEVYVSPDDPPFPKVLSKIIY